MYNFTHTFGNPTQPNQNSFSLGGRLNLITAPLYGFKGGFSFYGAESLDLNSTIFSHTDPTLPGRSVNVLGQSYLGYEHDIWMIRGGNQLINTPWLNQADTRMIPATYQGFYTTLAIPNQNLKITAFNIDRFKGRTSKHFNRSNLYTPGNYGGTSIPQMAHVAVNGAFAGGINYAKLIENHHNVQTQAWYYKFHDFGNLLYFDGLYQYRTLSKINPFIGAQAGREWGDGKNYLQSFGYGSTNSTVYGFFTGLRFPESQISLAYNRIPNHHGAYQNGDLVSPYTSGYVSDPLYTSSMMGGLIEKSSGYAFRLRGLSLFLDKKLKLQATVAKYFTEPTTQNTNEVDVEAQYSFQQGWLKGLIITQRFGLLNGNPSFGRSFYSRLMLQYNF